MKKYRVKFYERGEYGDDWYIDYPTEKQALKECEDCNDICYMTAIYVGEVEV